MGSDRTVDIAVLLPDLLGTYADGGNAEIFAQRSRWRDIPARVLSVEVGHALPTGCDLPRLREQYLHHRRQGWRRGWER